MHTDKSASQTGSLGIVYKGNALFILTATHKSILLKATKGKYKFCEISEQMDGKSQLCSKI